MIDTPPESDQDPSNNPRWIKPKKEKPNEFDYFLNRANPSNPETPLVDITQTNEGRKPQNPNVILSARKLIDDQIYAQEKPARERELKLTREFASPTPRIVFDRIQSLLESVKAQNEKGLEDTILKTELGSVVVFKKNVKNRNRWDRIPFSEALKLTSDPSFELAFAIKSQQPQSIGDVLSHLTSHTPAYRDYNMDPQYFILIADNFVLKTADPQKEFRMPAGYVRKSISAALNETFEDDTLFLDGSAYEIEDYPHEQDRSMREGMLRDALITLDQDIPQWYQEKVKIKTKFVTEAEGFMMSLQEQSGVFFNLDPSFKAKFDLAFEKIKLQRIRDPFRFDNSSHRISRDFKTPQLEIDYNGNLKDVFQSVAEFKALSIDEPQKLLSSGWLVQLRTGERGNLLVNNVHVKMYTMYGLIFRHPSFPDLEVEIHFKHSNTGGEATKEKMNQRLSGADYFSGQEIRSIDIKSTKSYPEPPEAA